MKKFTTLLIIIFFCTNAYGDKITKSGFLNNKVGYLKEQKINDPQNKILLIYNPKILDFIASRIN